MVDSAVRVLTERAGSLAGFCGALQEERGGSRASRGRPSAGEVREASGGHYEGPVCGRPVLEAATPGQGEGAALRGGRVRRLRQSAGLSPHGGAALWAAGWAIVSALDP